MTLTEFRPCRFCTSKVLILPKELSNATSNLEFTNKKEIDDHQKGSPVRWAHNEANPGIESKEWVFCARRASRMAREGVRGVTEKLDLRFSVEMQATWSMKLTWEGT